MKSTLNSIKLPENFTIIETPAQVQRLIKIKKKVKNRIPLKENEKNILESWLYMLKKIYAEKTPGDKLISLHCEKCYKRESFKIIKEYCQDNDIEMNLNFEDIGDDEYFEIEKEYIEILRKGVEVNE